MILLVMGDPIVVDIKSCLDCHYLKKRRVRHWLLDPSDELYEYGCESVFRIILPDDGVTPPPSWCPLRIAKPKNVGASPRQIDI